MDFFQHQKSTNELSFCSLLFRKDVLREDDAGCRNLQFKTLSYLCLFILSCGSNKDCSLFIGSDAEC